MAPPGPLSDVFLARWLRQRPAEGQIPRDLEDRLQQLVARGHAAWPQLALPAPTFARHLGTVLAECEDLGVALSDLHAEDLFLACACAQGLPAAHAAFERGFLTQVPAWLSRKAAPGTLTALADEVQQRLRERLLCARPEGPPRIARYAGRGKLLAWVRIACSRVASNLLETAAERRTELREPAAFDLLGGEADPELEWMKAHHREAFEDALRAALQSLPAEQLHLLQLHLAAGLSIDKLAAVYHLSRATMARRLHAAREALAAETERLLKQRLGLSASQVRSLARALRSKIDISLHSLLTRVQ